VPSPGPPDRRLWAAAALAAVTHAAAGAAAAVFVAPGAPGRPLASRLAYLQQAGWGWRIGWLLWIPAGAALIWLIRLVSRRLAPTPLATVALAAAAAALAVDACSDLAQAWLLPALAGRDVAAFLRLERWLALGSYAAANGLYSAAALAVTWAVARRGGRALLASGLPLAAAGLWLAWLGLAADYGRVPAAAAATVVLCIAWSLHLARVVAGQDPPPPTLAGTPAADARSVS
jgi:hypothetical protein